MRCNQETLQYKTKSKIVENNSIIPKNLEIICLDAMIECEFGVKMFMIAELSVSHMETALELTVGIASSSWRSSCLAFNDIVVFWDSIKYHEIYEKSKIKSKKGDSKRNCDNNFDKRSNQPDETSHAMRCKLRRCHRLGRVCSSAPEKISIFNFRYIGAQKKS